MAESLDPISERALSLARSRDARGSEALIEAADGRRAALETAYVALSDRLARRSDDFEATEALRLVNAALSRVGWPEPIPAAEVDDGSAPGS